VLIIFGAGKLPQVFRAAGQGIREFRKAKEGEFDEDKPAEKPKRRKSTKKS
jgi:TatA/E family protein of Tat protein translocase